MKASLDIDLDAIESAAWLLLDVTELLRESEPNTLSAKAIHSRLRSKINNQLRCCEEQGDPLEMVKKVRQMLEGA